MPSVPHELKVHYAEGRVLPFIGAGISMGVTWTQNGKSKRGPSWRELVDHAAIDLGFQLPKLARVRGTDLQILEYYKVKHANELARLTNWLHTELQPDDDALRKSPVHAALARLEKCRLLYTTNYDDFIERALNLHGRSSRAVAVEADMAHADGAIEVIKFHGDFNQPKFMVVTERDYLQRMQLSTAMDAKMMADLLNRVVLFIGYSFGDQNVAYLFHLINSRQLQLPESSTGRRAYIVLSEPSEFEQKLFEQRNISTISVRSTHITADIAAILDELRS